MCEIWRADTAPARWSPAPRPLEALRRVEAVLPSASPQRSFVRELERMGAERLQ